MEAAPQDLGVLQVEPTDRCNLACPMCLPHRDAPGRPHGVPSGRMSTGLFSRLLDDLRTSNHHLDHLILQWMGEPTLHPELPAMVGRAARDLAGRVGYLRVDTNGVALTPSYQEALVRAWMPHRQVPLLVVFSLDAVSGPAWCRVKGADPEGGSEGGRLRDRVYGHIRHWVHLRRRLLAPEDPLHTQLQFVLQHDNAQETAAFVTYWNEFLRCHGGGYGHDQVLIKRLHVGGGDTGQAEADRLYDRTIRSAGLVARAGPPADLVLWEDRPWQQDDGRPQAPRGPCPGPWMTPVVRWDGELTVCCADLRGELALGSLERHRFFELWHGPRARAIRLAHVRGDWSRLPVCKGCGGIAWYDLSPERVRRWLASVDRTDLWPGYVERMGIAEPPGD